MAKKIFSTFAAILVTSLLVSCGGGGGGGGAGGEATPPPIAVTPVMYSISGNFTGLPVGAQASLQNNGIDTVAITANGNFTFPTKLNLNATYAVTISTQPTNYTCTVTLGSGAISSNVTNVAVSCVSNIPYISVNTNITSDTYPSTYNTVATNINSDICNIDGATVSYPKSWNGAHTLPTVTGAPLNGSFLKAVIVKDILPDGSLPTNCNNPTNIAEFDRTVARLKLLNTDIIQITQWHWAMINSDGSYTITGDTYGSLSDSELTSYIQAAHSVGIKVMMSNQIQGFVNSAGINISTPEGNSQNWGLWFTAFQAYMINRATVFQSLGVDYWEMGCSACVYGDNGDGSVGAQQLFSTVYPTIFNQVAALYRGKKYISTQGWMTSLPNYINGMDLLIAGIWTNKNYTSADESAITVEALKSDYIASGSISSLSSWAQLGKPIMFSVGIQSRNNVLSLPGSIEETMCTNSLGSIIFSTPCIQTQTTPDFGLQAIIIEAQLETLSAANLPAGSMVVVSDYWQTDFMSANGPTFPDIAYSIRNKPAEGIVKQWFAK